MIDYNSNILKIEKEIASKNIENVKIKYDKYKAIIAKAQKEIKELENLNIDTSSEDIKVTKARKQLEYLEAQLEVYRKLKEESRASKFDKKGDASKGKARSTFEIKPVNDLTNEITKSALEAQKELNDQLLAGDKASYSERIMAAADNFDVIGALSDSQYFEDIEKAQKYHDKMLDDLEDAIKKKSVLDESQLTEEQFRLDLEQNLKDTTLIASQNHNKRLLDDKKKLADEQVKIAKWALDKDLDISDDIFNKQIIAAKAAYNSSKKTAKDKEDLERAMTKIAIEMANARIEVQIKELESQKILYKDFPEKVAEIERMINDLRAAVDSYDPPKEIDQQFEKLKEVLEFVGEASQAITDLGDALFDRKIETINAEIQAESEKYDKLIDLAKNNKDQQVRLQAEKEARIKELETKRLKEEQKKARFDKANAVLQIGINTAMAIMQIWGHSPDPSGISQGILTGIISTIGALQAAAVLAQPIPKYKDGLKNSPNDHIGMINDGGRQEFIERDGNILTTSTKNAIVNLKKGDTVHKSYNDLISSDMFSDLSRSILLNGLHAKEKLNEVGGVEIVFEKHLKNLNQDIKKGIHDGFNKVKINNITKIDMNWIAYKNNTL